MSDVCKPYICTSQEGKLWGKVEGTMCELTPPPTLLLPSSAQLKTFILSATFFTIVFVQKLFRSFFRSFVQVPFYKIFSDPFLEVLFRFLFIRFVQILFLENLFSSFFIRLVQILFFRSFVQFLSYKICSDPFFRSFV